MENLETSNLSNLEYPSPIKLGLIMDHLETSDLSNLKCTPQIKTSLEKLDNIGLMCGDLCCVPEGHLLVFILCIQDICNIDCAHDRQRDCQSVHWRIGVGGEGRGPPCIQFIKFHAVFGKIWQNHVLVPSGGNPGSATVVNRYFFTDRRTDRQTLDALPAWKYTIERNKLIIDQL